MGRELRSNARRELLPFFKLLVHRQRQGLEEALDGDSGGLEGDTGTWAAPALGGAAGSSPPHTDSSGGTATARARGGLQGAVLHEHRVGAREGPEACGHQQATSSPEAARHTPPPTQAPIT